MRQMKFAVLSGISLGRCFYSSGLLQAFSPFQHRNRWNVASFCSERDALFESITKLVLSCDLLVCIANK